MTELERNTGHLFGNLWSQLKDDQFKASVELFRKRAIENKFDLNWLKDKHCLDAGCGSGRYSVAMSLHGARSIKAIDISESGLLEAKKRATKFDNIKFSKASVLDLPFENSTFDFVWCAGVIHHTLNFDKALSELTRVLKKNGKLFLLVYGAGGLRWKAIKSIRPIVRELSFNFLDKAMSETGLPENNRKHFLDDLFVPIQKLTSYVEIKKKLLALNFNKIERWTGNTFDQENDVLSLLDDLQKIQLISEKCLSISTRANQTYLSKLMLEISTSYVKNTQSIIKDKTMSKTETDNLVIGERNLRIIASK